MDPKQHYKMLHKHDFLTEELLKKEYLDNKLTDKQIAKKYGINNKVVIWRKRKQFGIENRYKNKTNKNARKNRIFDIGLNEAIELRKKYKTYDKMASALGWSKVVLKDRFRDLGLRKKQDHPPIPKYHFYDIDLTENQKQLLVGTLLGDGQITVSNAYSCVHSTKQKEYFDFKKEMLASICRKEIRHGISKDKDIWGNPYESFTFTTGCNKYCRELRQIYYPQGKKTFPYYFLLKNMSTKALAYWYMDDGSCKWRNKHPYPRLLTYGFSSLEQVMIKFLFEKKWDIKTRIEKNKNKGKIRFNQFFCKQSESIKFINLVRPYILSSMLYKADYDAYLVYRKNKDELTRIAIDKIEYAEEKDYFL